MIEWLKLVADSFEKVPKTVIRCFVAYISLMSLISVCVTCYDKYAAKHRPEHRTPEKTLILLSALGGSAAMFVTMLIIRHKTRHASFMIGIPAIILAQAALICALITLFG